MKPEAVRLRCATVLAVAVLLHHPLQAGGAELVSRIEVVSVSASDRSVAPSLSADGRFLAFQSTARNLVAGQATQVYGDVFLRDLATGTNVLVSHVPGSPSTGAELASEGPVVSAGGGTVVFHSSSSNLVAGQVDTVGSDLFAYDRATGTVSLVSHTAASSVTAAGAETSGFFVSADGRYVAFASRGQSLVPGETDFNSQPDVYLYDRTTGLAALVSHQDGSATTTGNLGATPLGLSADGRWVLLASDATDLVPDGQTGLFLYDRTTGLLSRVAPPVVQAALSADGAYVAIQSQTDLVPGQIDPDNRDDLYLHDRQAGTFALITHASASAVTSSNGTCFRPVISADGSYVAYLSAATDLVAGQTGPAGNHLYLYERAGGANTLISHASASATTSANAGASGLPALSSDGRWVAYASFASDLVAGQIDTNLRPDVFLYDRTAGTSILLSRVPASALTAGELGSLAPLALSADGRWTVFASDASNLAVADFNAVRDVFVADGQTGTVQVASAADPANPALTGAGDSGSPIVSDDGRHVAFATGNRNMAAGVDDPGTFEDVFLRDRTAGDNVLVSDRAGSPGTPANGHSWPLAMSGDGRWVAFSSEATDVVAGQTDLFQTADLFLWDRETGGRTLVTHTAASPTATANAGAGAAALSADGRHLAFVSIATNLVDGQIDAAWSNDVFVHDRVAGTTTLLSHKAGAPLEAAGPCQSDLAISADGRWVAFLCSSPELIAGLPASPVFKVYLHDLSTGTTTLASRAAVPGLQAADAHSFGASMSQDGRFLAFSSSASDLLSGPLSGTRSNAFLYDRDTGTVTLASHIPGSPGAEGNGASNTALVSPDGTAVVFLSTASDLVAGQTGAATTNVFRYNVRTGAVALASHTPGSPTAGGNGAADQLAAGPGGSVVYRSRATDLVAGQTDTAGTDDVFLYDPRTGANRLLSALLGSATQASGFQSGLLRMSRNGRLAVFADRSSGLVAGDYNDDDDLFAAEVPDTASELYTVAPCRLLDTRDAGSGPALSHGVARLIAVQGHCGIPPSARAVVVNVTAVGATGAGNVRLYPSGLIATETSTLNFAAGQTRANNAFLPLTPDVESGLAATPFVAGGGTVHLLLDVTGYFE